MGRLLMEPVIALAAFCDAPFSENHCDHYLGFGWFVGTPSSSERSGQVRRYGHPYPCNTHTQLGTGCGCPADTHAKPMILGPCPTVALSHSPRQASCHPG